MSPKPQDLLITWSEWKKLYEVDRFANYFYLTLLYLRLNMRNRTEGMSPNIARTHETTNTHVDTTRASLPTFSIVAHSSCKLNKSLVAKIKAYVCLFGPKYYYRTSLNHHIFLVSKNKNFFLHHWHLIKRTPFICFFCHRTDSNQGSNYIVFLLVEFLLLKN